MTLYVKALSADEKAKERSGDGAERGAEEEGKGPKNENTYHRHRSPWVEKTEKRTGKESGARKKARHAKCPTENRNKTTRHKK